jgi:hypothetical protein
LPAAQDRCRSLRAARPSLADEAPQDRIPVQEVFLHTGAVVGALVKYPVRITGETNTDFEPNMVGACNMAMCRYPKVRRKSGSLRTRRLEALRLRKMTCAPWTRSTSTWSPVCSLCCPALCAMRRATFGDMSITNTLITLLLLTDIPFPRLGSNRLPMSVEAEKARVGVHGHVVEGHRGPRSIERMWLVAVLCIYLIRSTWYVDDATLLSRP